MRQEVDGPIALRPPSLPAAFGPLHTYLTISFLSSYDTKKTPVKGCLCYSEEKERAWKVMVKGAEADVPSTLVPSGPFQARFLDRVRVVAS